MREHPEEFCTSAMQYLLTPQAQSLLDSYQVEKGYWEKSINGERKRMGLSNLAIIFAAGKYAQNFVITSREIEKAYEDVTNGWEQYKPD